MTKVNDEVKGTEESFTFDQGIIGSLTEKINDLTEIVSQQSSEIDLLKSRQKLISSRVIPSAPKRVDTSVKKAGERVFVYKSKNWRFANPNQNRLMDLKTGKTISANSVIENPKNHAEWLDKVIESNSSVLVQTDKAGKAIVAKN